MEEAAVIGATNAEGLTKPHAFLVGDGAEEAELRTWLAERLEPYKVPRTFTWLEKFPRTHLGKVDRGALRRRVESGEELPQANA